MWKVSLFYEKVHDFWLCRYTKELIFNQPRLLMGVVMKLRS